MGLEADCTARFSGRTSPGKARLEEKDLFFRGDFSLRIPLGEAEAEAKGGRLVVVFSKGRATFELGKAAAKWALKIRYPRSRIDKLGVKPGMRVAVLGIDDEAFRRELRERVADVTESKPKKDSDLVFCFMDGRTDLVRLAALRASIKPNGAIWIVWPKGRKEFREDDVRKAAISHGLVDVKVVSFSDVLSGLKLMIPLSRRGKMA
jgi:hypothetical protein